MPVVVHQEYILDVDSDLGREGAGTVPFFKRGEPIVLAGRNHFLEDDRDAWEAMLRREVRQAQLRQELEVANRRRAVRALNANREIGLEPDREIVGQPILIIAR